MSDEILDQVAKAIGVVDGFLSDRQCAEYARAAIDAIKIKAVPCGVCGCAVYPQLPVSVTVELPEMQKTL